MSKKELQETVTKQQSELSRYKSRLADLVAAHKCLLKEKEVLEASLKALSREECSSLSDSLNSEPSQSSSPERDIEDKDGEESVRHLKGKLKTLMNSIAALSEEKSRMEAGLQSDKRQLRAEKLQLENTVKELNTKLETEAKAHSNELENIKTKLIAERHQREKEHNDHGVMIRELQKVVAEERGRREKAECAAESFKSELSSAVEAKERQERRVKDLMSQLNAINARVHQDKHNSNTLATNLHHQLQQLKIQHVLATAKEQERAKEAEERAQRLAAVHEERVANLEARLAELSQTVGSYDRLRHSDQVAIDKLKERLLQLEMEHGEEKADKSVDDLMQQLKQIAKQLQSANQQSEKQMSIKALLMEAIEDDAGGGAKKEDEEDNTKSEELLHSLCQQEYDALKQEFDNYRKQFFIQHSSSSPSLRSETQQAEVDGLKSQVTSLKDKIRSLYDQMESLKREHKNELQLQQQSLISEKAKCRERVSCLEFEWRERVMKLESELSKQRERALAVVTEKEQEIAHLRDCNLLYHRHHPPAPPASATSPPPLNASPTSSSLTNLPKDASGDSEEAGSGRRSGSVGPVNSPMLYYSQEVARRDVELSRLRKHNYALETELRSTQAELTHQQNKNHQLTQALDQQLQRFERCQSLKGANLEYLKNVVLSFLLSNDANCKKHMLNAIAAVLKFTDQERKKIAQHSWWYNRTSLHFDFVTTL